MLGRDARPVVAHVDQRATLGRGLGHDVGHRHAAARAGFVVAAKPGEQAAPHAGQQVIVGQGGLGQQLERRAHIGEVLAELKLTLNRREQFALEKVLVDELLGLGPLEELLADSAISDIMVSGPEQTFVERKGKLELANI